MDSKTSKMCERTIGLGRDQIKFIVEGTPEDTVIELKVGATIDERDSWRDYALRSLWSDIATLAWSVFNGVGRGCIILDLRTAKVDCDNTVGVKLSYKSRNDPWVAEVLETHTSGICVESLEPSSEVILITVDHNGMSVSWISA